VLNSCRIWSTTQHNTTQHPLPPPPPTATHYQYILYVYFGKGGWGESRVHKRGRKHRVHILVDMKPGQCICPLSWSVRYTATLLVMVIVVKVGGRAPPHLTSQANFTLMMECTPESGRYYSVYSVVENTNILTVSLLNNNKGDIHGVVSIVLGPPGCAQTSPLLEPGSPRFFWWYENSE
jgi:hypothetical protein